MRYGKWLSSAMAICCAALSCLSIRVSQGEGQPRWAKAMEDRPQPVWSLAVDAEAAKTQFKTTGQLGIAEDDILKRKVFQVDARQTVYARTAASLSVPYRLDALVRLPDKSKPPSGMAIIRCGVRDKNAWVTRAFSIAVSRYFERGCILTPSMGEGTLWTQPYPNEMSNPRWGPLYVMERFPVANISPLWDEDLRIGIENDMARLPLGNEVWRRLRVEVSHETIRIYHQGLLVVEDENRLSADGQVMLELYGEARLASLEAFSLIAEKGLYLPVGIEDICNASGPVRNESLPEPAMEVRVNDIPFVFPARTASSDHVDVRQSLFRYRLGQGYDEADPMKTWPPPMVLDPARIRLRVPNYAYQRIWIIAASDEEPDSTPVITARFYKPYRGWAVDSAVSVPGFQARSGPEGAKRLKVTLRDGRAGSLWLMPLEIDAGALASDFREEPALCLELTKEVKDFRAFPDPMFYDRYQAGLPSAVRVYALTLEKAPVSMISSGNRTGKVYTHPENPLWLVDLKSQGEAECEAKVRVEITSPGGAVQRMEREVEMTGKARHRLEFLPTPKEYGLHRVRTEVVYGKDEQVREGSYLTLPPDTRATDEKTNRWGLWCWGGGHGTNEKAEENLQILRAVGSRIGGHMPYEKRKLWGIAPNATIAPMLYFGVPEWSKKEDYDRAEYEKFSDEIGKQVAEMLVKTPDLQYVSVFAEHMISLKITHGNPPEAFGLPWHEYSEAEKTSIRSHLLSAKAAFEGVRKHAPNVKFLFGHCGPLFSLPFMRDGYPKELFDGYGVDSPQFERMPERPPRAVEPNHLYFLKQEMKRLGYEKKELIHVESYYPSSHRLALGHRGSADSMVRTAVLSLALGSTRFFACWTTYDCEDYWGSQHYGCIGIISRRPEYNPKPAAAAFATMTRMVDTAQYDGYVDTGSRTAYCVRFKDSGKWIYCLWTIRGTRPLTLHAAAKSQLVVTDENGNSKPLDLADAKCRVTVSPTALWVTATGGPIEKVEAGQPVYQETPGVHRVLLEDFEKSDWNYDPNPYPSYAFNEWDVVRTPGTMKSQRISSAHRGSKVWEVSLTEAPEGKPFVSWYGVYAPAQPLPIPGKAKALGIYANGNSGWGRILYEVVDAKGEVFQSIGTKDDWNCDDVHSWSYFNFDGWRYMEFPLPANSPGDDYREKDSVWWNHSAEGIVDLPLKLNKVIVEIQTHQIYVDEMLPVKSLTVELDDLMAVYEDAETMTDKPVQVQRAASSMLKPKPSGVGLPNPILGLVEKGVGEPAEIVKLYAPEREYDGTRIHVSIKPVEGAKEYQVWVAAYEDGRGAVVQVKGDKTEPLVTGLRPATPLYFFVTYTDAAGKQSKPSKGVRALLRDEFPMK